MMIEEFIRANPERIEEAWEKFALSIAPTGRALSGSTLRDNLSSVLKCLLGVMERTETYEKQDAKGGAGSPRGANDRICSVHADLRLSTGLSLEQVISEYRALRSSILYLWIRSDPGDEDIRLSDIARFNEAIDQGVAEAVRRYADRDQKYNDRFVGVLGHEIRNPLNAIQLASRMLNVSSLQESQQRQVSRIVKHAEHIGRLVDDLSMLVRSRMAVPIPLRKEKVDLGAICDEVLDQIGASHPAFLREAYRKGDLTGDWDKQQLGQVIFNLVANAIAHSSDRRVDVFVQNAGADVVLKVSNRGKPIPDEYRNSIFEPFSHRGPSFSAGPSSGLGLGLFVVREIVTRHKGSIQFVSNESSGTTFTVTLPRFSADQETLSAD